MQLSRRRRLIERQETGYATFPESGQAFPTRSYADPVNAFAYATPPQGVQNPQGTPYRSQAGVYAGAAPGTTPATRSYTGAYNAYDVASGHAYDATQANKSYNAYGSGNYYKGESFRPGKR